MAKRFIDVSLCTGFPVRYVSSAKELIEIFLNLQSLDSVVNVF